MSVQQEKAGLQLPSLVQAESRAEYRGKQVKFNASLREIDKDESLSPSQRQEKILALAQNYASDPEMFRVIIVACFIRDYEFLTPETRLVLVGEDLCVLFEEVFSKPLIAKKIFFALMNEFEAQKIFEVMTQQERRGITWIIGRFLQANTEKADLLSFVAQEEYLPCWTAMVNEWLAQAKINIQAELPDALPDPPDLSDDPPEQPNALSSSPFSDADQPQTDEVATSTSLPAETPDYSMIIAFLSEELSRLTQLQRARYQEGVEKLQQSYGARMASLQTEDDDLGAELQRSRGVYHELEGKALSFYQSALPALIKLYEERFSALVRPLFDIIGAANELDRLVSSLKSFCENGFVEAIEASRSDDNLDDSALSIDKYQQELDVVIDQSHDHYLEGSNETIVQLITNILKELINILTEIVARPPDLKLLVDALMKIVRATVIVTRAFEDYDRYEKRNWQRRRTIGDGMLQLGEEYRKEAAKLFYAVFHPTGGNSYSPFMVLGHDFSELSDRLQVQAAELGLSVYFPTLKPQSFSSVQESVQ